MKQQEEFNQYPIIGSKIEDLYQYSIGDREKNVCIKGKCDNIENISNKKCYYYNLYFQDIKDSNRVKLEENHYQDAKIVEFEANEVDSGFDIRLTMDCRDDDKTFDCRQTMRFWCKDMCYDVLKYRGMSYENIYSNPQYQALFTKNQQVYGKEECFLKADRKDLGNGYAVQWDSYGECRRAKNGVVYKYTFIQKCHLLHEETILFKYDSIYDMARVSAIITHQNGKSYFLFKTDLYGLNVYDMQSKDMFCYVPEGYQHRYQQIYGESFIITAIHYDEKTNLIAYEGCYWGGTSDVMVGDFSNPMNFNPVLQSVHEQIDPEYECYDDIDFDKWEDGKLHVIVDGKKDVVEPIQILKCGRAI